MAGGSTRPRWLRRVTLAAWFLRSAALAMTLGYAVGYIWWPLQEHIEAWELARPLLICLGMGLILAAGSAPPHRPETALAALGYVAGSLVAWIPGLLLLVHTYLDQTGLETPFDRFFGSASALGLALYGLFFALCFAVWRLIVKAQPYSANAQLAARTAAAGLAFAAVIDQFAHHPLLWLLCVLCAFAAALVFTITGPVRGMAAGAVWCALAYWLLPHLRRRYEHPLPSEFAMPYFPYVIAGAVAGAVAAGWLMRLMERRRADA